MKKSIKFQFNSEEKLNEIPYLVDNIRRIPYVSAANQTDPESTDPNILRTCIVEVDDFNSGQIDSFVDDVVKWLKVFGYVGEVPPQT